jgi:hypothetical protein
LPRPLAPTIGTAERTGGRFARSFALPEFADRAITAGRDGVLDNRR